MNVIFSFNSEIFSWVILPLLIFVARVCDVSLGTLRIIFVSRGKRLLAPSIGFFEILIWLIAIGQIFKNLNNPVCYFTYACGFAMGNYVGIYIEDKIAIGLEVVRIITHKNAYKLISDLKSIGYGVTVINGNGDTGSVKIIFTIIKRKELSHVISLIHKYNPKAFFSVEDIRMIEEGIFPNHQIKKRTFLRNLVGKYQKEK